MSNVSDNECENRRSAIFDAIKGRLGKSTFWTLFGLLVTILVVVFSAIGGMTLSHCMNSDVHIDARYPPVTKEVFHQFTEQHSKDIREIKTTQNSILKEIRKTNGHNTH